MNRKSQKVTQSNPVWRMWVFQSAFLLFLLIILLGGGASRNDVLSLPIVWFAALGSLAASCLVMKPEDLTRVYALSLIHI